MGPPKKGTKKYKEYLKDQKTRRAAARMDAFMAKARGMLAKELRQLRRDADQATRAKNTYMRKEQAARSFAEAMRRIIL